MRALDLAYPVRDTPSAQAGADIYPIATMATGALPKVGAKTFQQMIKHLDKLKAARTRISEMERRLEGLKGKKARDVLRDEIQRLRKEIKGHEKEIGQKWPHVDTDS